MGLIDVYLLLLLDCRHFKEVRCRKIAVGLATYPAVV